ncbi:hypothetical protein [Halovivax cerinus]|uniref:Uncharacterized protein n=1 Tax=Halovivax cerinus TaxID=1487865 RepID=A0ABD5NLE3_9EURY|nr:hypothetical protein [Halovivax cerinus]
MGYDISRLRGCTDEPIYEVTIEDGTMPTADRLRSAFDDLGDVCQPCSDRPLVRMEAQTFVLTGNLDTGRLRLRCRSTDGVDPESVRSQFERRLERAFDGSSTE